MEIAEQFVSHWRGMYGDEGLLLLNACAAPTDEQLEAIKAVIAPLIKEPLTGAVLVSKDVPTFTTPQRRYQKIEVSEMLPDPANAELAGVHTPESIARVGAWRWGIVAKHRDTILPLIQGKRTIDFGGLAGPVGYGSIVVDHGSDEYRALYDVPGQVDTIFTAHTLEHVRDLDGVFACIREKLVRGGWLVAVVPSWRFEFLRAEHYPHHFYTFCLAKDFAEIPGNYVALDIMAGMDVIVRDDDGESILVIARKR